MIKAQILFGLQKWSYDKGTDTLLIPKVKFSLS